ncbi:protease Do-like 1, chloroplastic [Rutidosis leptorrhynchoides]|uniref:protease Do-like 1, chloroplastic n=1 Tax=Rutidosis leptorrhynchoides TaxID=125765 RepID=UPI003A99EE12
MAPAFSLTYTSSTTISHPKPTSFHTPPISSHTITSHSQVSTKSTQQSSTNKFLDSCSVFVTDVYKSLTKLQLSDEMATIRLYEDNNVSVVIITTTTTIRSRRIERYIGSGFIWDRTGHVVTNYHVLRNQSSISVTLYNETTYEAQIVGFDPDNDIAVLHIDAPQDKLRPIRVGVSANLRVGQKVFAIGHPFGLNRSLTTGVISGVRKEMSINLCEPPIRDIIQTDAAINPGNSGGPLIDSSGRLIGINTFIHPSSSGTFCGIGFSIPVDTIVKSVDQLLQFGKVIRPILGIKFAPAESNEQPLVSGVLVLDVLPDGPAGKAGLRSTKRGTFGILILGDIITSINDKEVVNGNDIYRILDQCKVGETVTVTVLRGKSVMKIPVILEPKDYDSTKHDSY